MPTAGLAFTESDFVIRPEDLTSALLHRIDTFDLEQPQAKNKVWTPQVKSFLRDIGNDLSKRMSGGVLETIYTKSDDDAREFLFDVIWWYRGDKGPHAECLALAAEIEWASFWWGHPGESSAEHVRDRVREDFDKLVIAKAPLKLMVFCTSKNSSGESHKPMQQVVLAELDRCVKQHKYLIPGETYVFIDVASQNHRRAWVWRVGPSGEMLRRERI